MKFYMKCNNYLKIKMQRKAWKKMCQDIHSGCLWVGAVWLICLLILFCVFQMSYRDQVLLINFGDHKDIANKIAF